ncbi:hypothetical protein EDD11_003605 [Mortierella claussenii]|nr:hypothetical protein EDD11_003605 [Mortierella claussenii]
MASFGGPISRDSTGTIRRRADKDQSGFITGADAVPFFAKSGLSPQVLGQIWLIADADQKGVLGQQGFSIAVKLIAHAQNGKTPSPALINTDAPLPHFEGLTPENTDTPAAASPILAQTTGSEPPLTNEDKYNYGTMFIASGPVNGLLDGDKAREVFLRSKLPLDKLSQIWSLADTKQRGSLDVTGFTIAMYYIQHTMDGTIKNLPATTPASILRACAGSAAGTGISSPVITAQALPRQSTGNSMGIHNPAIARQLTGSLSMTSSPLAKQSTGGGSTLFGSLASVSTDIPWDVTPEEKAKFDRFFDRLDPNGTGMVGGEEASKFFLNSRLPESVLAQIWDLSDITGSGSLSRDEFAVAMLLINRKNTTGAPIPKTLPLSLVPPSLRSKVAASSLPFPSQEPLRSMTMPSGSSPQQFRRQSFDLLGDGPALSTPLGNSGISHADKDLVGTEDLTSKITSETGDLASMQNQFNNLSKVTGDLQTKRSILEKNLSALSAQKQDLSIRLNQIKTLHESETKSIKDMEAALQSIQPQLIKLREELVISERELTVARANKDEYFLSLAKDQEENNQIKARLRQNNDETVRLREELEAKKKDTGRQKGLLEIARRQLATSEADKQKLINEIAQESEKAAQAAKEIQLLSSSPAPSSPAPTASSVAPPPPAPRGSRKEPPPPPASRGTAASFTSRASAEEEEAFGIPEALRSPTGSFHSMHSSRNTAGAPQAPVSLSRQSTGSSPFDAVPRQGTGSSPFDAVPKQGTGSSPYESISRQGTGLSAMASSIASVGEGNGFLTPSGTESRNADDLWSPMTHAAHAKMANLPEMTMSPVPETSMPPPESMLAFAAAQSLPTSPPVSQDPFGSMAFPSLDTPPVTKMDFDSAFQGFSTTKSPQVLGSDNVKSAEAFAEAFPDIDAAGGSPDATKGKRMSAFGFEDDFSSSSSPFNQSLDKTKEDEEFPPIVEMTYADEESSDDSDDDNDDAFVQAKSSIASPEPSAVAAPVVPVAPRAHQIEDDEDEDEPLKATPPTPSTSSAPAPTVAPVSTGPSATKKLTDFSEFETSFGGGDDFDSAFKGVELSAPRVSNSVTGTKLAGFDDAFDFNSSFDDAFGASSTGSAFGGSSSQAAPKPVSSSGNAFGTADLDDAFGGFGVTSDAAPPYSAATGGAANAGASSDAFGNNDGFGDFGAEFSTSSSAQAPAQPEAAAPAQADPLPRPVPAVPVETTATGTTASESQSTTTSVPAPPQVPLAGVDELMNMGFTRQQAEDALLRYDNVERAANFLLGGE